MSAVSSSTAYFLSPGPLSDPGDAAAALDAVPGDVAGLCTVVQGLVLHVFWADRYGASLTEERLADLQHRSAAWKLRRILDLDPRSLTEPRALDRRLVGNCRDFTLLLVLMLRHAGVPARARCGFATYFMPDHFEDHWVAEYWDQEHGRWILVDGQLDSLQREALGIDFDPLDVPRDRFLPAGSGWRLARCGEADPDAFGIQDMHGLWFIRGDLLRDVAALNKVETLPWDVWGLIAGTDDDLTSEDYTLLDQLAAMTGDDIADHRLVRSVYEADPRLRVPESLLE